MEVDVAGGIDEIQLIGFAVYFGGVVERDAVGLDGDPALALQIHRVKYLFGHLAISQAPAYLNKTVSQGRLTMINVRNDREITD